VTILTVISPDELIATITAATISIRLIGATIGYSVYFNVYERKLLQLPTRLAVIAGTAGLPSNDTASFITALLTGQNSALAEYNETLVSIARETILNVNTAAFREIYLVSISFSLCAILASLFLGNIKEFMVDRVAVILQ
jgi:hypothetical protein